MKNKLLLPWEYNEKGKNWKRWFLNDRCFVIWKNNNKYHYWSEFGIEECSTLEKTQYLKDKILINEGYIFIDKERAEKLRLIL
jgi:hypothetical protein